MLYAKVAERRRRRRLWRQRQQTTTTTTMATTTRRWFCLFRVRWYFVFFVSDHYTYSSNPVQVCWVPLPVLVAGWLADWLGHIVIRYNSNVADCKIIGRWFYMCDAYLDSILSLLCLFVVCRYYCYCYALSTITEEEEGGGGKEVTSQFRYCMLSMWFCCCCQWLSYQAESKKYNVFSIEMCVCVILLFISLLSYPLAAPPPLSNPEFYSLPFSLFHSFCRPPFIWFGYAIFIYMYIFCVV